jgi:hypothetical protein
VSAVVQRGVEVTDSDKIDQIVASLGDWRGDTLTLGVPTFSATAAISVQRSLLSWASGRGGHRERLVHRDGGGVDRPSTCHTRGG